jgi:dGTPase
VEIKFFKRLLRTYVIENPKLVTQQIGQRQIICKLFDVYLDAVHKRREDIIPPRFHEDMKELGLAKSLASKPTENEVRLTIDIIACLTDDQASKLYGRLTGILPGSVVDLIHP